MGGERCATHDLALAPDGRCVLCRRAERPLPAPPPEPALDAPAVTRILTLLAGAGLAGSLAFLAYTVLPRELVPESAWASPVAPPPERATPSAEPRPASSPTAPAKPAPEAPAADPTLTTTKPTASTTTSTQAPEDATAREEHEQDLRRKAMIERDWEDRARKAARASVSVTMYTTAWCGACSRARTYMNEHGIVYVERNVDESAAYRARARALNPRGSVPTFDVDGRAVVGFTPDKLEHALDRAVAARSGR